MLPVDLTRVARSHSEKLALLKAIAAAPVTEPETDWVEWKSQLDVSQVAGAFAAARSILGFANRDPSFASRYAQGCAYFVVGAEPGNLCGSPVHDPADVEQWLGRYLLRGEPQWSVDYVEALPGVSVLFVTVEAPRPGDPIHTLQREFERSRAGAIFVRSNGKTETATPAQIARLSERLLDRHGRLELGVRWKDEHHLAACSVPAENVAAWIERETLRIRPASPPQRRSLYEVSLISRDRRSVADFNEERRRYLRTSAPRFYELLCRKTFLEERKASLRLTLVNSTDQNFRETQVTLTLPPDVLAYFSSGDLDAEMAAVRPPVLWGEDTWPGITIPSVHHVPTVFHTNLGLIDNASPWRVTLPTIDVRPGEEHDLEEVHLVIPLALAGETIQIDWRATSTGVDGDAQGSLTAEVASDAVSYEVKPFDPDQDE